MSSLEQIFSNVKNCFSASHFLIGSTKCNRLHGHNYSVTVHFKYNEANSKSVIDSKIVKTAIQKEIKMLNQKILLPEKSSGVEIVSALDGKNWQVILDNKQYSFPKQDSIILEGVKQTTTENIAKYLHQKIRNWLLENYPDIVITLTVYIAEKLGYQIKYSAPV